MFPQKTFFVGTQEVSARRERREQINVRGFFLRDRLHCTRSVLYSESTRVDISNTFALLVFENRRLQRSFQKIAIGNLSQQDKTRAVRITKWKLECVLY